MSPLAKLGIAGGILGVGLVGTLGLLFGTGNGVRSYLDSNFTRTDGGSGTGSVVYTSPDPPAVVTGRIAGEWKPAERLSDPGGFFLRYQDSIVAVTAGSDGGSNIFVDDEDRGYVRWYPYIGGFWGTYSGPGEGFRGGGPVAGK